MAGVAGRRERGSGRLPAAAALALLALAYVAPRVAARAATGAAGAAGAAEWHEAPIAPTISAGAGVGGDAAHAQLMRVHTAWGGSEWADREPSKPLPPGVKLKLTPQELDDAYGDDPPAWLSELEDGIERDGRLARHYWEEHVASAGGGAAKKALGAAPARGRLPPGGEGARQPTEGVRARRPAKLPGNQESRRIKAGQGSRAARGQVLSPIGQEEQGVNPRGQPCPDWGLDSTDFQVVGFAAQTWRKYVEIRSMEGEVLGTIKRGCPAWTNAFVWKVPPAHASGCRDNVDPNVFSSKCQIPEVEILYTDEFSGLLNPSGIRIMDCHDDMIFSLHEERREIIVHDYKIKSDFIVKDLNGNTMGYCRQSESGRGLAHVGDHNFTIVDMEGEVVATATRPLHWANGAQEHVWDVQILVEPEPLTLSDMRVVATAVVNNVLLHESEDFCSDIVFALTPILITFVCIGVIAAISTCLSWFKPEKIKP